MLNQEHADAIRVRVASIPIAETLQMRDLVLDEGGACSSCRDKCGPTASSSPSTAAC